MTSITVIGPCYNEFDNIDEFISRITSILEKLNLEYEVLLIDDGSKDNSWQKILEHSKKNNKVHGIKFTRNFGHQSAIMAGINFANSDYVFFSDIDLQDPPELLEQMYQKITKNNLNVVFAKRVQNNENFLKKYSSILFQYFLMVNFSNIFHASSYKLIQYS